ncbi:MAG: Flp family type IVb pilin [Vampirovibrionia bacterium]
MKERLFWNWKKSLNKRKNKGQSLVEYGLILALVSVVAISVLTMLGGQINSTIDVLTNVLKNVSNNISTTGT